MLSSLHKKADRLSAYVEMLVVNESKVEFGYMDASYPFKGRPRDGHICREEVSRRLRVCDRGPQEFQSDIIHHRIETKIQAVFAAGASKKTQIRSVLTAAFIRSRSCRTWI